MNPIAVLLVHVIYFSEANYFIYLVEYTALISIRYIVHLAFSNHIDQFG